MGEGKSDKAKVEAILLATSGISTGELADKVGLEKEEVENVIEEINEDYEEEGKGMLIIQEGDYWKVRIKSDIEGIEDHVPPEINKGTLRTLAVIAAKKPVKQSIVSDIRGNKAYKHIKTLEEKGFIFSEPHKNTKILDLTSKFYKYFDLSEDESLYED